MKRRAFSLIELLTVIAISSILLTIIAIPLIQSFNLTKVGQSFADAQDRARIIIDRVTREISTSVGVRDNTGDRGAVDVWLPGRDGSEQFVRLYNSKLDILMPQAGDPLRGPNGALLNPNLLKDPNGDPTDPANWKEDPTLKTPVGQVSLPATTGFRLVRYFIGLRSPFARNSDNRAAYANPYNTVMNFANRTPENLYVLYRAEVDFKRWDSSRGQWVLNSELFGTDPARGTSVLDDPAFFVPDGTAVKASRIRAWLRQSRILTDVSRYDAIEPVLDKATYKAVYDGNVPRVLSLVQFRPTRVANEPAEGQVAVRTNEEFEGAAKMGSDNFRTKYGGWTNESVRSYPSTRNDAEPWKPWTAWRAPGVFHVAKDHAVSGRTTFSILSQLDPTEGANEVEVFDISAYNEAKRATPGVGLNYTDLSDAAKKRSAFPFSFAVEEAHSRSGWKANRQLQAAFSPFAAQARLGQVQASFGIEEVGTDGIDRYPLAPSEWKNKSVFSIGRDNRPYVVISGNPNPFIPNQDPEPPSKTAWTKTAFSPSSDESDINRRFNVLWNSWNFLFPTSVRLARQQHCKRFLDLRFVNLSDGTKSPLNPELGWNRVRIVPGSEVIIGPDQIRPYAANGAANYVRYNRVSPNSTGNVIVGPNEYAINYVDRPEPSKDAFDDLGLVWPNPNVYTPGSFESAILQSKFKAGYVEFNSDPNSPLPAGNLYVYYRFQFTEAADVFSVDYDTRQVVDVSLTVKNYPSAQLPNAQTVTLRGSSTARNFVR